MRKGGKQLHHLLNGSELFGIDQMGFHFVQTDSPNLTQWSPICMGFCCNNASGCMQHNISQYISLFLYSPSSFACTNASPKCQQTFHFVIFWVASDILDSLNSDSRRWSIQTATHRQESDLNLISKHLWRSRLDLQKFDQIVYNCSDYMKSI